MVRGFVILLLCQLIGEVFARTFMLPAPGPVVGLALLTFALWAWDRWRPFSEHDLEISDVGRVSQGLLGSLSLLFVPAGVGVVQYLGLLSEYGAALALSLIVSTALTLIATVLAFLAVKRLLEPKESAS